MGASIEELVERVYWNPGERAHRPSDRRPFSERLAGFFQVLPANAPAFDPPPRDPVGNRLEAAAIFGQNVRTARERRHLTQANLARAAGFSKAGLSLIERGVRETTIDTLLSWLAPWKCLPRSCSGESPGSPARRPAPIRPARAALSVTTPAASMARSSGSGARARQPARSRMCSAPRRGPFRQSFTACATTATCSRIAARQRRPSMKERGAAASGSRACLRSATPLLPSRSSQPTTPASRKSRSAKQPPASAPAWPFIGRPPDSPSEQLGEATEVDRTYLYRIENGRAGVPRISLVVKLAASFNVSCSRVTAGITWDPSVGKFKLEVEDGKDSGSRQRLGQNARRARRKANISQQALGARASMCRGDVVDFERGSRNFRIFAGIKLAGALGGRPRGSVLGSRRLVRPAAPGFRIRPGSHPPAKAERDALLARLWREGRPERDIAVELCLKSSAVGPYVRELRDAGERLSYRRAPRRAVEVAARRRRCSG